MPAIDRCGTCLQKRCICVTGPKFLWYVPYRDMDISINRPPNVTFCGTGVRVSEEGYHITGCGIDNISYRQVVGPFKTKRGAAYASTCCYGAQPTVEAYENIALTLLDTHRGFKQFNKSTKSKRNHNPKPTVSRKSLLAVYRAAALVCSTKISLGELGRRLIKLEEAINEAENK